MDSKQILDYLDKCEFPILDNGYYYHIDQRMSIFKKDSNWAILIQILAYNNHELDVLGIKTMAYTYGNLIPSNEIFENSSIFSFAEDSDCKTFIAEENTYNSFLNPNAKYLKVRSQQISIEHNFDEYKAKGIDLEGEKEIAPWELMRYVCPEFSAPFWITREEIATKIPLEMKEVATLSDWQHPDGVEEGPSDMESFKIIANYIENWNQNKVLKIKSGNTHWRNYLVGGDL